MTERHEQLIRLWFQKDPKGAERLIKVFPKYFGPGTGIPIGSTRGRQRKFWAQCLTVAGWAECFDPCFLYDEFGVVGAF